MYSGVVTLDAALLFSSSSSSDWKASYRVGQELFLIQGDHSSCAKPHVDFKSKVPLWPGQVRSTVALWAGGPVYLCSSAAVASLPAQAGSSVVYTAAGFEGPTASLPAKQGNITKSNKLKQQEVSRTACPKCRCAQNLKAFYNGLSAVFLPLNSKGKPLDEGALDSHNVQIYT